MTKPSRSNLRTELENSTASFGVKRHSKQSLSRRDGNLLRLNEQLEILERHGCRMRVFLLEKLSIAG